MKIVFLGTPDFAVAPLEAILNSNHEVLAVITQPDRLGDRNKLIMPAVKQSALLHGIKVLQYDRISRQGVDDLRALAPDIMVTAAYGQILSREILAIPKHGVINIHASLLPKYRGSSPIQWAIINGESVSGVSIMQTEYEVDSGDILMMREVAIGPDTTADMLFDMLSACAAEIIVEALDSIEDGTAHFTPQDVSKATYCKMLSKADGTIDFNKTAAEISCLVRGVTPWPGATCEVGGEIFKVFKTITIEAECEPCELVCANAKDGLVIGCRGGAVRIAELQARGGKRMSDTDYLRGHSLKLDIKQINN